MLIALDAGPLDNLGTVFTQIGSWMTAMVCQPQFGSFVICSTITSSPLLLLSVGIFATGAVDVAAPKKSRCIGEG